MIKKNENETSAMRALSEVLGMEDKRQKSEEDRRKKAAEEEKSRKEAERKAQREAEERSRIATEEARVAAEKAAIAEKVRIEAEKEAILLKAKFEAEAKIRHEEEEANFRRELEMKKVAIPKWVWPVIATIIILVSGIAIFTYVSAQNEKEIIRLAAEAKEINLQEELAREKAAADAKVADQERKLQQAIEAGADAQAIIAQKEALERAKIEASETKPSRRTSKPSRQTPTKNSRIDNRDPLKGLDL